jgi:hypothetical protein
MFDDINRVDSTIFKPHQTAPKKEYRGNSRKKRDGNAGSDQLDDELEPSLLEGGEEKIENKSSHNLDIQV